MKLFSMLMLTAVAFTANAYEFISVPSIAKNDIVLVVDSSRKVSAALLGDLSMDKVVLVKTKCMEQIQNSDDFIEKDCFVKKQLGTVSINEKLVIK